MWHKLTDERFDRRTEPGHATLLHVPEDAAKPDVIIQRWKHEDGRRAVHVTGNGPLQPELLVLDADGVVLREYDLPGQRATPDPADPMKGAKLVRAVGATAADDIDTPGPDDDDAAWALLRGWS